MDGVVWEGLVDGVVSSELKILKSFSDSSEWIEAELLGEVFERMGCCKLGTLM